MARRPPKPETPAPAPPPKERVKKIPLNELQRRKLLTYHETIAGMQREANSYIGGMFEDRNIDPATIRTTEVNLDLGGFVAYVNLPPAVKPPKPGAKPGASAPKGDGDDADT